MQLARDCMKYSIKLLKLNFTFIVLLQIIKLILVQENRRALLNFDGNVIKNETSRSRPMAETSLGDVYMKYDNQESQFFNRKLNNEFVLSLSSWYAYDIKQMEATKTEILNIITNRRYQKPGESLGDAVPASEELPTGRIELASEPTLEDVKPIMITTSLINFNELLQFNNLKNVVKLAILLNLNLTCILANLLIVSFIILRNAESRAKGHSGRTFRVYMKFNLNVNIFLFLVLLLVNTVYLIVLNNYNRQVNFDSVKWISGLINMNSMENDSGSVKNLHAKIETNSFGTNVNGFMHFLLISNAKINVFFMIVSICLMFTYGYLIKLDCCIKKRSENEKDSDNIEKEPLLSLEEGPGVVEEIKSLPSEIIDSRSRMIELKQKKLERIASIDLQWIMHSLLVIYLLSVWDIADVYQYMQDKNVQSNNLESFLAKNAGAGLDLKNLLSGSSDLNCKNNLIVLNKLNYDYINMQLIDLMTNDQSNSADLNQALALAKDQNIDVRNSSFILNKINKYYYNYNSKFYHHSINYHNKLEYGNHQSQINTNGTITNHQKLKSVTKIKILFILKKNTQLFGDILIMCFSFIVLIKLRVLNKLTNLYSNLNFLKHSREQTLI